eukprot:403365679
MSSEQLIKLQEEEIKKQELEKQREERRKMMSGMFGRKQMQSQTQDVQMKNESNDQQTMIKSSVQIDPAEAERQRRAQQLKDLEEAQKQHELEQQRQARAQRMQQVSSQQHNQQQQQQYSLNQSKIHESQTAPDRQISAQQQKMMDQRASALKNRNQQVQEEIKKQEEDIKRMQKFEKDAYNEFKEERKAESRLKTIQIQSVLDKSKETQFQMEIDQSAQKHKLELENSVQNHYNWLMNQLLEQNRSQTDDFVDVIFTFSNVQDKQIKCNSSILSGKSLYFNSLLKFESEFMQEMISQSQNQNPEQHKVRIIPIDHFTYRVMNSVVNYFYTGTLDFESDDIIELLELCQEYLLYDVKQLLEQTMIKNIDNENFAETMQVVRAFDCKILREALFLHAKKNYQTLYSKGGFKSLKKDEWTTIKEMAKVQ